ncbi:hypothetical protein GCM10027317_21250 [Massilia agri]
MGNPLIPLLCNAKLITMNEHGMLHKDEERPQSDAGPAYTQEWSARLDD